MEELEHWSIGILFVGQRAEAGCGGLEHLSIRVLSVGQRAEAGCGEGMICGLAMNITAICQPSGRIEWVLYPRTEPVGSLNE